jgi:serine/threonine protein kinase
LTQERGTSNHFVITFAKHATTDVSPLLEHLCGVSHRRLLSPTGFSLPNADRHRPLAICTPYYPNGSLAAVLESGTRLKLFDCLKILFGIAEAIRHLHSIGVNHQALTAANVLFDAEMEPVICDFGRDEWRKTPGPADILSYGCLIYSVLTGTHLKPQDERPEIGEEVTESFRGLVQNCWSACTTFEAIVLSFFGKSLTAGLSESELLSFRTFQGLSVPPSFGLKTMLNLNTKIQRIMTQNNELFQTVNDLKLEIERIAATPASIQTNKRVPPPFHRPVLQIPKLSPFIPNLNHVIDGQILNLPDKNSDSSLTPEGRKILGLHKIPPFLDSAQSNEYGVCARLNEQFNGNVARLGIVTVRGNSYDEKRDRLLPEILNHDWGKCWISKNVQNSWLQFNFGSVVFKITHYGIKTYPVGTGFSHLKSWVLQGSMETDPTGLDWINLDVRENTMDLNGRSRIGIFPVSSSIDVRSIKLKQTGLNHARDHFLILTNIEFYGSILSDT